MSTHIVDRVEAIRFPKEMTGDYDDNYLILQLGGDNNVTNMDGHRARDWSAIHYGQDWRVIARVCEFAGDCEGGMTRFIGSNRTSPETYIRKHRTAMKNAAIGWDGATQRGFHFDGEVKLVNVPDNKIKIETLSALREPQVKPSRYDGAPEHLCWTLNLRDPEEFKIWHRVACQPTWNYVRVFGPDTR